MADEILAPIIIFTENYRDKIEIVDDLTLRKITANELIYYFGADLEFDDKGQVSRLKSIGTIEGVPHFWDNIPSASIMDDEIPFYPAYTLVSSSSDKIRDLILALHLLKEGNFFCPKGKKMVAATITNTGVSFLTPEYYYYPLNKLPPQNYKIMDSEHDELIKIYHEIVNSPNNSKHETIKARLKIVFDRSQKMSIRFIEAVSIIESIITGNEQGELTFRFSLYSSYLLSNKLGVDVSRNYMNKIYGFRSGLTHTGEWKKNDLRKLGKSEKEIFEDLLRYTKLVYREYIRSEISGNKIIDEIEKKLNIKE